jgi:hypothetical protein
MKRVICLSVLSLFCAWADEPADRAAIANLVSALGVPLASYDAVTADFTDYPELARLGIGISRPTVVISHEVWGEATLVFGNEGLPARLPPRFVIGSIRFVAADVALVNAASGQVPVLIVMKKEGPRWRIASLRQLSQSAL